MGLFTGCVRDGRRADPGAGGPGLLRHGHPGGEAGSLHGLRRHATYAVPAGYAGRGHRQRGRDQYCTRSLLGESTLHIS